MILKLNDKSMSTLAGHFVLSPREREKETEEIVEEMKEKKRTGKKEEQEWKWKKK